MKLISWNVNGLRSCLGKGFEQSALSLDADVICLQEIKVLKEQVDLNLPGYEQIFHSAEKKGYSGTAAFTRERPLSVSTGLGIDEFDHEGRVITLEYPDYYLVNCYTPNAQDELRRLPYRMRWDDAFRAYLRKLDDVKPAVSCGDLNVAHKEIDLKHPRANRNHAGFTDQERGKFTELLDAGFIDSYRHFYPDQAGAYSWWSYFSNARANNSGWRLDYFVVSEKLKGRLASAAIHPQIFGSDHCPVEVVID